MESLQLLRCEVDHFGAPQRVRGKLLLRAAISALRLAIRLARYSHKLITLFICDSPSLQEEALSQVRREC
jgi:hypothetical protein